MATGSQQYNTSKLTHTLAENVSVGDAISRTSLRENPLRGGSLARWYKTHQNYDIFLFLANTQSYRSSKIEWYICYCG
jgi:hypothetical protein